MENRRSSRFAGRLGSVLRDHWPVEPVIRADAHDLESGSRRLFHGYLDHLAVGFGRLIRPSAQAAGPRKSSLADKEVVQKIDRIYFRVGRIGKNIWYVLHVGLQD
jgi:hypothetical protein